jgi:anti-sigma factor RsiW
MTCLLMTKSAAGHGELLLDYTAGKLDSADRAADKARLEQHMEECATCASFRIEQAAVWEALDLWEPAPVSMDFNRRLWQRIDGIASTPWYMSLAKSLRFANWKPLFPLTAAILVIAAGFLLDHPGSREAVPGVTIREADQVEQTLDDIELLHQLDTAILSPAASSKRM